MKIIAIFQLVMISLGVAILSLHFWQTKHPMVAATPLYDHQWEFKTVTMYPKSMGDLDKIDTGGRTINIDAAIYDQLGQQGWQICGVYSEQETVWPIVTTPANASAAVPESMQPNIRPKSVTLIFQRPVNLPAANPPF